jgi:hypothetical protein
LITEFVHAFIHSLLLSVILEMFEQYNIVDISSL